jgi:hypothetical protein
VQIQHNQRMTTQFQATDVTGMVSHWLGCPEGGYLGSDYGSDVQSLVQSPMAAGLADDLIAKCRADIPLLQLAPPGTINVYSYDADFDRKVIAFDVAGQTIEVDSQ